jgi:hypothetical protein
VRDAARVAPVASFLQKPFALKVLAIKMRDLGRSTLGLKQAPIPY